MTPEEIRDLHDTEPAATAEEAEIGRQQAEQDPESARAHWEVLKALAPTEKFYGMVMSATLGEILVAMINERIADDQFALLVARASFEAMDKIGGSTRPPEPRTPRGKPGKPKMA